MMYIIVPYDDRSLLSSLVWNWRSRKAVGTSDSLAFALVKCTSDHIELATIADEFAPRGFRITITAEKILAYSGEHNPAANIDYIRNNKQMSFFIESKELDERIIKTTFNEISLNTDDDETALLWWEMVNKKGK